MLSYNEIKPGVAVLVEGEPYVCTWNNIMQKQQRRPVNQTKLRHLVSGKVLEISFHQNESMQEADVGKMQAKYLYTNRGESWFAEMGNAKNRFSFPEEVVHGQVQWLAANTEVEVVTHEEKPLTIKIPVKVELKVAEAPPNVKGDTATGGMKPVKLSTGASVNVPLFINTGDTIRINTDTGTYTERVEKA